MKKVAIVQSNYIPWKGYFDMIAAVDEFILYDDVQYTRRDWRNRNLIKTPKGAQWLTVPVLIKGKYQQQVNETTIDGQAWSGLHWKSLSYNYRRAACFDAIATWLEPLYTDTTETHLSQLNYRFIREIVDYLGINTTISHSSDYTLVSGASARLAHLCEQVGATEYVSGPTAKRYLDESVFAKRRIALNWFNYDGYKTYPQLWGDFTHRVSIIDLLFNCGADSEKYMRYA